MTLDKLFREAQYGLLNEDFFRRLEGKQTNLAVDVPYNQYLKDNKDFVIEFALAGYKKDQIIVEVEDNSLIIETTKSPTDVEYIHHGIKSKDLYFKFSIVNGYDSQNIKPSFKDGILKIVIPKSESNSKTFKL